MKPTKRTKKLQRVRRVVKQQLDVIVRKEVPPARFIEGWFTDQYMNGYRPDRSEPRSRLPEPRVQSMEVVTGFFAKAAQ